jgi:hypothetical protein
MDESGKKVVEHGTNGMNPAGRCVLSLNGGSTSIKFALYHAREGLNKTDLCARRPDQVGA